MLTSKSKTTQKLIKVEQLQKQYNSLQQKQDQWIVIQNLNKLYKVDRILLKHAYEHYPELQILKNSKQYKNIQKFYRYTLDNMLKIQQEYLMDEISVQGSNNTNYQINKKSTSKYIRDQITHYEQTFKQLRQKVNEQEYGLNGAKLYNFVKQCFNTKFTKVLIKGEEYFTADARITQFYQQIKEYYCNSNGIDESVYRVENVYLTSQQILDFLTHWLKSNEDKQFYILYCRTQQKLMKDMQYLIAQAKKNKIKQDKGQKVSGVSHPVTMKEELSVKNQPEIVSELNNKQEIKQEIKQQIKQQINQSKLSNKSHAKISNFLEKFKNNKVFVQQSKNQQIKQKVRALTKKQILMAKLPELYVYGCKRKYSISKRTTFDQIQSQSKTMNLEKFLNFCNHFQINKFLSRQLLTQIFKNNAINRLSIDEPRFVKIMETIIKTDQKTIDNFLQKKSIQKKLRSEAKLSNYKFSLIPINGKNLQTLQTELQQKKIIKSMEKQQKLNMYFMKKQKQKQRGYYKKQKSVVSSKILPQFTNLNELQNMRDDKFDPQKFFGNDHDELLSQYQSKIESTKDFTSTPSALQSILSKRLQKGNKILQKINSSILKSYE